MTHDPVQLTLATVLDELKRGARRTRGVGDLAGNMSWWMDVRCGTPAGSSSWRLEDVELDEKRLKEAPYLAAVGYLATLGVVHLSVKARDALTKIAKRSAHTAERTGYADDLLVLAGLWLVAKHFGDEENAFRKEAVAAVQAPDAPLAGVALLCLVDPSLGAKCRPFVVADLLALAVAVAVGSVNGLGRMFLELDVQRAPSALMSAACAAPITPSNDLERAFVVVGLHRALSVTTRRAGSTSPNSSTTHEENVDIAILVALREEFRHLHPWLNGPTPVELEGHQYYRSRSVSGRGYSAVSCFVGDMGPVPAALATSRLIDKWHPRWVVLIGVGGAVSKDIALGDVVVASQVDSYLDAGKAVDDEDAFTLQPSGAVFRGDRQLVSRVRNFEFTHVDGFAAWQASCRARYSESEALVASKISSGDVQLHDGTIASGPLVGASEAFRRWLTRRDRGYKAIEMEGGAVHWAAEQSWTQPRMLVVRGMSDRADPNKSLMDETGRGAVRAWAMQNAIAFVWKLLETGVLDMGDRVVMSSPAARPASVSSLKAPAASDAEILKSFERVLDRPALYEPFDGCGQRDFGQAIADMIKALNTGIRSTRDGAQLEPVLSRFDLKGKKEKNALARIVRDLGEVRERHAQLVKEEKVSAGCGCINPLEEATKIDELRERIVTSFKSVYPSFNVVVRRSMTAPRTR